MERIVEDNELPIVQCDYLVLKDTATSDGLKVLSMYVKLFVLNHSDAQTEDGHAMMKFDSFQAFWNLSHAVRGCHNNCRKCARMSQLSAEKSVLMLDKLMCTRHQRPEGK